MKRLQPRLEIGAFLVACLMATTAWADDIPRLVPYQGYLELSGQPVNGTETLLFELLQNGTTTVWSEEQVVTFTEGRFSVFLGESSAEKSGALQNILARGLDLFLKITIRKSSGDVALDGMQRLAPAPYAMRPAVGMVPIGTVIDWWRPTADTPIPEGYVVADGSDIEDSDSPLYGTPTPNLTNKFIRGVTNTASLGADGTGGAGGTTQHNHSVDLPSHNHTVSINHDHAAQSFTTSANGAHRHQWAWHMYDYSHNNWRWKTWTSDGNVQTLIVTGDGLGYEGSDLFPISTGKRARQVYTSAETNHRHTVSVNLSNYNVGNRTTTGHDPAARASTQGTHLPPYVGLLKLIRVK
jgi:hypothetical protein